MSDEVASVSLSKLEGAGNDFLVVVEGSTSTLSPEDIRTLCDRHYGIGADGVIVLGGARGGAELSMVLTNADGTPAEMSGNGIRCLAYIAVESGMVDPPSFRVDTAAGIRTINYTPLGPGEAWASVDMGQVALGEELVLDVGERAQLANVGNPHVVILVKDIDEVDLAVDGARLEHQFGANIEFIAPVEGADEIHLVVWERGAGETLACGTGSVAAAAVAHHWGLTNNCVRVHNPGGTLEVLLDADRHGNATLAGPVKKIADVVVERDWLA
jgi:diaminopimelate epimerase